MVRDSKNILTAGQKWHTIASVKLFAAGPAAALNSLLRPPFILLILGIVSIFAATAFICTGKVWVRFNGWVYRAKEPRAFWGEVASYYLVGVCFIGYGLSN